MSNELQFRKDIITGFSLIIVTWCKDCKISTCKKCQYHHAASEGHLNMLLEWFKKKEGHT